MDRLYFPVIILHLSIVAKKNILLQRSHNYGVWNYWQQKLLYCICYTIWIAWHMIFGLEQEGESLIAPMALVHPLHPIDNRSRNRRRNLWVGWCVSSWWPLFPSRSSVFIYMYIYIYMQVLFYYMSSVSFGLPIVSYSLMIIVLYQDACDFWRLFKQHFDTRYLVFCNPSPPKMFLSLDLLSEYRIQHGAIRPLYVISSFSTWIFCRGGLGFATDCPCDVWCRWKSSFKQQLGCRIDIRDSIS